MSSATKGRRSDHPVPMVRPATLLAIDQIEPNDWNPFKMTGPKFDGLVAEIRQDGFDEPIKVIQKSPDEITAERPAPYRIADGEHRWRAARVVGYTEIPAVIYTSDEWNLETQKLKTVRRNMLRGELDPVKFTRLVDDVLRVGHLSPETIRAEVGMPNDREFASYYLAQRAQKERVAKEAVTEGQRVLRTVTDVGLVVKQLIADHGDTIPLGFIAFMYGGHLHLMVECTGPIRQFADMVRAQAVAEGRDINAVLLEWIGNVPGPTTP